MTVKGKIPPHALDLEKAVLGAIMIEKGAIYNVLDIIPSEKAFYNKSHELIYKAILGLFNEGEPIDILTVIEQVRRNGDYDFIGGTEKASYFISQLTIHVNSAAHITTHARIITEKFLKRETIRATNEISKLSYLDGDAFEIIDKWQQYLIELSNYASAGKGFESYHDLATKAFNEIEDLRDGKIQTDRESTGFVSLDKGTSKWGKGELIIIAGRPGMGKSALIQKTINVGGIKNGKRIALFSLEMANKKFMLRTFASEAKIELEKLKTGQNITESEWTRLFNKAGEISQANIFLDDTPAISLMSLSSKAKKLAIELGGLDMIVIDYLQLMTNPSAGGNREQEIGSISRGLKVLAKELDLPIVALAQLSRKVEDRGGDKKPMLSDLRESGSIEQDADQVMFVYRPEYYGITEDEDGNSTFMNAEVIIAKNRDAAEATVKLKFEGRYMDFSDWGENEWSDSEAIHSQQSKYKEPSQHSSQGYDEPLPNSTDFDFIP